MGLRKFFICTALLLPVTAAYGKRKSLHDEFTGQGYGTAGCGLGSVVFGEKPGMVQIFASTTNQYFFQTFAISSGTSNCDDKHGTGKSAFRVKLDQFVVGNGNQLKNDIARASGESLSALETMGGCESGVLGSNLQKEYSKIFSNENNQDVSQKIYDIVAAQAGCQV